MFRGVPKGRSSYSSRGGGSYRGRGRGDSSYSKRSRGGSGQPQQARGLFADGIWTCNCAPRLPAEHFKVKKEGRNQGRWFYTCQNGEGRRCDFFLWDEDAKPRMEAAVLNNSRDEPRSTPINRARDGPVARTNATGFEDRSPTQSPGPPPAYSSQSESSSRTLTGTASGTKRTLGDTGFDFDGDEDEPFPWALTGQEEAELVQVADGVSHAPETPRKAVKTDAYATPATTTEKRRLPWLDYSNETAAIETPTKSTGLPTPATKTPGMRKTLVAAPDTTPTPVRFRDALAESTTSELTDDVFSTLKTASITLTCDAAARLKGVLTKHDLRTQGIAKGRDISRLAIKAKDAKIVELQARISALEAEREVDRARIRGLRLKDHTLD